MKTNANIFFENVKNLLKTYRYVHVRYMLSPVRLPVVCLSETLVHPTQAVAIFCNFFYDIWYLGQKILWRSSQANPSVGGS